ncbi:apolipoprotein N-acyltransferase [Streptomyces solincola]|uniref:Apolipoprotein N-acyltransferase n=1 Tax=Streptomyces solincola TaxID=2100817 RepID=A0A2S9PPU1_9ACTN|nr:apolipoprotein N-acyltransferase [Streptomyces solincola]PRH76412.1 apolipoprotein N-acyltransferase [Streptomyces solincola]
MGGAFAAGTGRRLESRGWRGAAALVAGALPALAFPAPALWWFAYVALAPWLLLLRTARDGRRAAYDGWLGGAGFMLAAHHWLVPNLHVFIVLLAALLGLLWAPWGWLAHRMLTGSPARALAAVAVVPAGWLVVELARSWQGLGGPWGLLGASQWQVPGALKLASVGGVWFLSLLVVAVNTAVALLLAGARWRRTGLAALMAFALAGLAVSRFAAVPEPAGSVRVAVVQPGVIHGAGARFAREEELTRKLAGRGVDLVVWGESSVGADLAARPEPARRLTGLSRQTGASLLVNVDARRADRPGIYKSSVLVGPDGLTGERYDKMRLVPFGEYVPFRPVLGWVTSVGEAAGEDRRRGTRPVVMDLPGSGGRPDVRIGPLVCFETAFPDMSRELVRRGAQVLVAQSATSTFQQSWAPEQHASLAALRAAETGRPMVHATLTGVSTVHGPDGGRIGAPLGTAVSGAAVYEVPLAAGATPYVRIGPWPVYLALAILAAGAGGEAWAAVRRLRTRQQP